MQDYEKLGAFYLGRKREQKDELVLYGSKDLLTHAVCVGMTGSGKTGLCIGLLEEAAIDGIPAIVIDPKGDLAESPPHVPSAATRRFPALDQRGRRPQPRHFAGRLRRPAG